MKKILLIEDEMLSANRLKKLLFNIDNTIPLIPQHFDLTLFIST